MQRLALFKPVRRSFAVAALVMLPSVTFLPLAIAQAEEGVQVGGNSAFSNLVPASEVEQSAAQQYAELMKKAAGQRALAPANNAQLVRLRSIARRIIPFAQPWNSRAKDWKWEVNLIAATRSMRSACLAANCVLQWHSYPAEIDR